MVVCSPQGVSARDVRQSGLYLNLGLFCPAPLLLFIWRLLSALLGVSEPEVNFGRFAADLCSTPIWWRRARFSSSTAAPRTQDRRQGSKECRKKNTHQGKL